MFKKTSVQQTDAAKKMCIMQAIASLSTVHEDNKRAVFEVCNQVARNNDADLGVISMGQLTEGLIRLQLKPSVK